MNARKITHKEIDPNEYYLLRLSNQKDIDNFCKTVGWITPEDLHVGNVVVKYDKELKYFEVLDTAYVKRKLQNEINVKSSILTSVVQFFDN